MLMLCLCTIAYAADPVTLDITALDYQTGKAVSKTYVNDDGVYPYVYNMAANANMRVREGTDIYVCMRAIDPLLYPPSQVAAHFIKE